LDRSTEARTADLERVEKIRRGDEGAFAALFDEFQPTLRRVVRHYVDSPAVAEEVIQETWLGVIRGIFAFEGRSSLKTWVFRILVNRAKTRATREKRTVPFAEIGTDDLEGSPPSVDPAQLLARDRTARHGPWNEARRDRRPSPEEALLGAEVERRLAAAIDELPSNLRVILTLRDVEGWSAEDVCNALGLSDTNQRVLLHRARLKVRAALAPYLRGPRGVR
jgi:RNA polymerase sigma-70 factor (ECF subfamily)